MLFLLIIGLLCFSGLIFAAKIAGGILGAIVAIIPHADEQGKKVKTKRLNKEEREANAHQTAQYVAEDYIEYLNTLLEDGPEVTINPDELDDLIVHYLIEELKKTDLVLGFGTDGVITVKKQSSDILEVN